MELQLDEISFRAPFEAALAETGAAIRRALPVSGAAERVQRARDEREALRRFGRAVEERLRERSFARLPRLRRGWRPIPHLYRLDEGPWRGVFLLDPAGDRVVGLVFSRAPHDYGSRLDELVARHARVPDPPRSQDGR